MSRSKNGSGTIARAAMLISSLTVAAFVFTATETVAQAPAGHAVAKAPSTMQIGQPVAPLFMLHAKKATLRTQNDMMQYQAAHPDLGLHQPAHRPLIPMGQAAYERAKREAALQPLGVKPGAGAPPPSAPTNVVRQFLGPKESDTGNGYYPPDSNGAISPNNIVALVNLSFNVYSRTGTLQQHTSFGAFMGTTRALSDPRVIYDTTWKRWVVTLIGIPANSSDVGYLFIAISKNSNPNGAYWVYQVGVFSGGGLWDYDQLGMSQDAVLITGNHFEFNNTYDGAVVVAIQKAALYNGQGWSEPLFGVSAAEGTVTPPIVYGPNNNVYFAASNASNGTIDVFRGTNMSNAFQATFSLWTQLTASNIAVPRDANQVGTALQLDTLDGRFQGPSTQYYRSSDGHTMLWNVKTGTLSGFPAVYYYEIDAGDLTTPAFVQSGTVFNSNTSDDWNPSIAVNTNEEAIITWSSTDAPAGKNSRIIFSGRQSGDPLGAHIGPGKALTASGAALTGNTQGGIERWGDYSSTFLDSYDAGGGCVNRRAGIFNEKVVDSSTWGVQVGIVGFC